MMAAQVAYSVWTPTSQPTMSVSCSFAARSPRSSMAVMQKHPHFSSALLRNLSCVGRCRTRLPNSSTDVGLVYPRRGGRSGVYMALGDSSSQGNTEVYQGVYGPWSVDSLDVREVVLYRAGLVTAAATFIAAASTAVLPDDNPVKTLLQSAYDPLYALGAGGLGMALFLIHIYVTPIKRTLQLLWVVGVLGSLGVAVNFAAPANQGLVNYVIDHPAAIWAVGPLFASLTGLVFKEGLCYGKLEAAALFFVIPSVLLGRLSGVLDEKLQVGLLVAWMGLLLYFPPGNLRSLSRCLLGFFSLLMMGSFQNVYGSRSEDDIGDKSVFIFNALPEESKQALLTRLQDQQPQKERRD